MEEKVYCKDCDQKVVPVKKMSLLIAIFLAILFFPAAIIYLAYKYMCPEFICPICGGKNIGEET